MATAVILAASLPSPSHAQTYQKLHQFETGQTPFRNLIQGSDGNFYGVTQTGGNGGGFEGGTVYKLTPAGALTTLVNFVGPNGWHPNGSLVQATDGNFYGTTYSGGSKSDGTVFKLTPGGIFTTLVNFNSTNGASPNGGLVQGTDGNLYGTTAAGGTSGYGTVFKMDLNGALTTLVNFTYGTGGNPYDSLIQGTDGNFYGTTYTGGSSGDGTVFKVTSSGTLTTLASFNGTNGKNPTAGLRQGADGNFYGTTVYGGSGSNSTGTIFRVTPAGALTTLVTFNSTNGAFPGGSLLQGADGNFYGTTQEGGSTGLGSVFKMTPGGTLTTLHWFNGTDGEFPVCGLVQGTDGNIYGTTAGTLFGINATAFKITTSGTFTTLVKFDSTNGGYPTTGLVLGTDNNFYGATNGGGTNFDGTAFMITTTGAFSVLNNFPVAPLPTTFGFVLGSDGNFYGANGGDGNSNGGAIVQMTPGGTLTTLFTFTGTNGKNPRPMLLLGKDGNFYGTTSNGGSGSDGTVFKITSSGALTTLVNFTGANGKTPLSGLVQGVDGNFYGTTSAGGTNNDGTVFMMTSSGALTTLVNFNGANGNSPSAGLVQGKDGNFYGTTSTGGSNNDGTIFKVTPGGALTTLVNFNGSNGNDPEACLVQGADGNFYGTTYSGGVNGQGTVFKMSPSGVLTTLLSFDGTTQGANPGSAVVFGPDGNLYGTASSVIYRLVVVNAPTVITGAADGLTVSWATLRGTVNPNFADASIVFQYGLTGAYGASTPSQDAGSGTDPVAVSASVSNLSPHTLYHYTLTATNSQGVASGADATFTTLDTPPVANSATIHAPPIGVDTVIYTAAADTSDADGDAVTITGVTGGSGEITVSGDGSAIHYVNPGFTGSRSYTVNVSDGFGGTASGILTVTNAAPVATNATVHAPLIGVNTVVYTAAGNTSDADGDAVTITGVTGGSGEITVSGDGSAIHYVNPGFTGSRSYTVNISDGFGGTASAILTVTNAAPVANPSTASVPFELPTAISVLGNDSDPDNDSLVVISASAPSHGALTSSSGGILYAPAPGYVGADAFSYQISDGRGGTATTTVTVMVQPPSSPNTRQIAVTGGTAPGAGVAGSGIPPGAHLRTFASPAINNSAQIAYVAAWSGKPSGTAIFLDDPIAGSEVIASKGQTAPDATGNPMPGVTFSSFDAPVLNEDGSTAFLAKLTGVGVTPANKTGIFTTVDGALKLVARTGDAVAIGNIGHGSGADGVFSTFQSAILQGSTVLVSATLVGTDAHPGPGGVKSATNTGVWSFVGGQPGAPIVQKGGITEAGGAQRIKTFRMLNVVDGSPGQYRFQSGDGSDYTAQVTYADGTQAILGPLPVLSGTAPTGLPAARFESFGTPALDHSSATGLAYLAKLRSGTGGVTAANDVGIFTGSGVEVARSGFPAPGASGAAFKSFLSPICNSDSEVAFIATLHGLGITPANNHAIYLQSHDPASGARYLSLVAQTGVAAPGAGGALFGSFNSVAVPDLAGTARLYFVAKLAVPVNGQPNPLGLSSRNDTGLWAQDSAGNLKLILRDGELLQLAGGVSKTLRSFSLLGAVTGSAGQARSFNDYGGLVYNAFFTDGSQAILTIQIP